MEDGRQLNGNPSTRPHREDRLIALAAAVRAHESSQRQRPYAMRHVDLSLYRRMRQILGA
jgi:hypothetical protein